MTAQKRGFSIMSLTSKTSGDRDVDFRFNFDLFSVTEKFVHTMILSESMIVFKRWAIVRTVQSLNFSLIFV